jgi:SnoaL-like domain
MASRNLEAYHRLMAEAEFEHDLTSDRSRQAMVEAFTADYVMVEPPSLPHGGVWEGRDEWLKMNSLMGSLWDQTVTPQKIWDIPEDDMIILYSHMEWTAKATGKSVSFPAIELLYYRDAKICKVEMFLQDTKMILDTLEADE